MQANFNDQNLSNYVQNLVESSEEKCDECEKKFSVHYTKCIFHEDILRKRKLVDDENIEPISNGNKRSPYKNPKLRKISLDHSEMNGIPTKVIKNMFIQRLNNNSTEFDNEILRDDDFNCEDAES